MSKRNHRQNKLCCQICEKSYDFACEIERNITYHKSRSTEYPLFPLRLLFTSTLGFGWYVLDSNFIFGKKIANSPLGLLYFGIIELRLTCEGLPSEFLFTLHILIFWSQSQFHINLNTEMNITCYIFFVAVELSIHFFL